MKRRTTGKRSPVRAKTGIRNGAKAAAKETARHAKRSQRGRRGPAGRKPAADAVDALVTANAQTLGLALDPSWHAAIKFNLALILRFAALVDEFPLPDDLDPGPVFHA